MDLFVAPLEELCALKLEKNWPLGGLIEKDKSLLYLLSLITLAPMQQFSTSPYCQPPLGARYHIA